MKKWFFYVVSVLVILGIMAQMGWLEIFGIQRISFGSYETEEETGTYDVYSFLTEDDISYRIKAEGDFFQVYYDGKWTKTFWKGVNLGASKPGYFAGELGITYDDYYRWFEYISEMNCNCIRVYTILMPDFYTALYDFNSQTENPLYLFQGVWIDEVDISTYADVYAENSKIKNDFIDDALDCADVIHGNATLPERTGFASGTYVSDVSKWLAGWILGIEFDPKFILNTNETNPDKDTYDGEYLYTYGSTPFEAFLCEAGDKLISHEVDNYGFQVPIAFTNWITTDPLTHPEEPHPDEDLLTLNTESIKSRTSYKANLFASYHVYPYYPDSMNYQKDYINYKDDTGKINTYKAYLEDLKLAHTVPIMISEFGVATSRGKTHESIMGYNQGGVDETEQGEMIADMFNSIYDSNYAGGIVFAWQDEWFKRTWNNETFDISDSRPYWSNYQTSEQNFGILSFDPGETETTCILDGKSNDWNNEKSVLSNEYGELYMKVDEKYVYFMLKPSKDYDFNNDTVMIPIDLISGQGNTKISDTQITFDKQADFLLEINGKENSRILCDAYYDVFYFQYGEQYEMISLKEDYKKKDSGIFNKMNMCYGYEMKIPSTGENIPFASYETGKLTYGNGDTEAEDYSSLSDFCYGDCLEIRIPWQLLNFMDPSKKMIMDDFYSSQSITSTEFENFNVGLAVVEENKSQKISLSGIYTYEEWEMPTYHERLKPSYYVLQKALKELS